MMMMVQIHQLLILSYPILSIPSYPDTRVSVDDGARLLPLNALMQEASIPDFDEETASCLLASLALKRLRARINRSLADIARTTGELGRAPNAEAAAAYHDALRARWRRCGVDQHAGRSALHARFESWCAYLSSGTFWPASVPCPPALFCAVVGPGGLRKGNIEHATGARLHLDRAAGRVLVYAVSERLARTCAVHAGAAMVREIVASDGAGVSVGRLWAAWANPAVGALAWVDLDVRAAQAVVGKRGINLRRLKLRFGVDAVVEDRRLFVFGAPAELCFAVAYVVSFQDFLSSGGKPPPERK